MKKIAIGETENTHLALLFENGMPVEFFAENKAEPSRLFNIYQAKVENVRPNGLAFLRISETDRAVMKKENGFKVGDIVTVMVDKEFGGGKFPSATTKYTISTPSVVWTGDNEVRVSRRASPDAAVRFKQIAEEEQVTGLIFRSEAENFTEEQIIKDIALANEKQGIIKNLSRRAQKTAPLAVLSFSERAMLQSGATMMEDVDFTKAPYAEWLRSAREKRVEIPSVGNIVIEQTEAFVSVDINTGAEFRYGSEEETAYQTNLRAVEQIAKEIRLRNLSGTILVDAISMREAAHRDGVVKVLREALRKDSVHAEVTTVTPTGIIEIVRERRGVSLEKACKIICDTVCEVKDEIS